MTRIFGVGRITKQQAESVVKNKHYSRRLGIFWEGFGLFIGGELRGVVCYGQPSAPIQKHAFRDRDFRLYELTRLVLDTGVENGASTLISHSLRLLSAQPCAVVSYADSAHGHCGIVYQATNWLYTGATKAHDSLYLIDGVPTHAMSIIDRFGVTDPGRWAKENNIERIKPGEKHRYFTFVGDKRARATMRKKLAYQVIPAYPKVDKRLYDDTGVSCAAYISSVGA